MIAIDTNVLLRRILGDNEEKAGNARRLFDGTRPVLITDVVLAETVWTLTGKRYRAGREDIRALITSLLEEANATFENKQVVWSALNDYMAARTVKTVSGARTVDLADALIVNKARAVAHESSQPYEGTYTFDQAALQIDGTKTP